MVSLSGYRRDTQDTSCTSTFALGLHEAGFGDLQVPDFPTCSNPRASAAVLPLSITILGVAADFHYIAWKQSICTVMQPLTSTYYELTLAVSGTHTEIQTGSGLWVRLANPFRRVSVTNSALDTRLHGRAFAPC